ncbi:MAG: hypothetical protein WB443_07170 [Nitrososphaeraceae archaeon]
MNALLISLPPTYPSRLLIPEPIFNMSFADLPVFWVEINDIARENEERMAYDKIDNLFLFTHPSSKERKKLEEVCDSSAVSS